jgi:hypothetical protein
LGVRLLLPSWRGAGGEAATLAQFSKNAYLCLQP